MFIQYEKIKKKTNRKNLKALIKKKTTAKSLQATIFIFQRIGNAQNEHKHKHNHTTLQRWAGLFEHRGNFLKRRCVLAVGGALHLGFSVSIFRLVGGNMRSAANTPTRGREKPQYDKRNQYSSCVVEKKNNAISDE